jgi:hypothetical protein
VSTRARAGVALVALVAAGCTENVDPGLPIVVLARGDDGGYALEARDIDGLDDAIHLEGRDITVLRGGVLAGSGYRDGGRITVDAIVDDGALVAMDEDGLVLFSFYAALTDARADLLDRGYDVRPIFPIQVAFNPASQLDFFAAENAAFVTGERLFILFPDALEGVPLAANAGVVRHEFGHAVFEWLTSDEPGGPAPYEDLGFHALLATHALNEGFADTVATLTLDDPDFFSPSQPFPARDVSGAAVASPELYPKSDDWYDAHLLDTQTYDPYGLGTVYASFVWDIRLATDPDTALELATSAIAAFGAESAWDDPDRYVGLVIEASTGDARAAACASAATRFPELELDGC